jgi:hypothetical protein
MIAMFLMSCIVDIFSLGCKNTTKSPHSQTFWAIFSLHIQLWAEKRGLGVFFSLFLFSFLLFFITFAPR